MRRLKDLFAEQKEMSTIDLLDWFNGDEYYYIEGEIHFNKLRDAKTAEALAKVFESLK